MKLIFTLAAVLLITTGYAQLKIGKFAPEVSLADKDGKIQAISSLKGKVVLIDFWASWCMPCRKSNRILSPIYNKYKSKGFEIYGISLDEEILAWQKAIDLDNIKWLQVKENGGWDSPTAVKWYVEQLPSSWLL